MTSLKVACKIFLPLLYCAAALAACSKEGVDSQGIGSFDPSKVEYHYCAIDEEEINAVYERLTLRQKIGQHIIIGIERSGKQVDVKGKERIQNYYLGGVMVSQITGIASGDAETSALFLRDAQLIANDACGTPLFISSDQEGGVYTSVNKMTGGTDSLAPAAIGATKNEWTAFKQFDMMGREIKALGINMNFGPLLDTHYNRENGNLNTRTFGPDVDLNEKLGLAAFAGYQSNLVIPTVKHFPGDGMLAVNTHREYSINKSSKEELEKRLLKPFRAAFAAGADAVMIIPAQFTALDEARPAITSKKIMVDFLRGELSFTGLIVTDDLNMFGARFGLNEAQEQGYEALKAGADMLLYVAMENERLDDLFRRIESGLQSGDLKDADFTASTKRIIRHKQKYCLLKNPTYPTNDDIAKLSEKIGLSQDAAMSLEHAQKAVAKIKDDGVLPISGKKIICVGPDKLLPDPASGWSWIVGESFCEVLKRLEPSVNFQNFVVGLTEQTAVNWVEENSGGADVLVVATFNSYFGTEQQDMLGALLNSIGLPVVHVAQGVAFDAIQSKERSAAAIALQGSLPIMFEAGARVLLGECEPEGVILFDLNP